MRAAGAPVVGVRGPERPAIAPMNPDESGPIECRVQRNSVAPSRALATAKQVSMAAGSILSSWSLKPDAA